jgi:hypothetical protein
VAPEPTPPADDCERCRIDNSDGFRLPPPPPPPAWLLDDRCPGVWERGIGGARSCRSLSLSTSASSNAVCGRRGSMGDVASAIFCDRTTFVLTGDCCSLSRPAAAAAAADPLAWSAIVRPYDHFSAGCPTKTGRSRSSNPGEAVNCCCYFRLFLAVSIVAEKVYDGDLRQTYCSKAMTQNPDQARPRDEFGQVSNKPLIGGRMGRSQMSALSAGPCINRLCGVPLPLLTPVASAPTVGFASSRGIIVLGRCDFHCRGLQLEALKGVFGSFVRGSAANCRAS